LLQLGKFGDNGPDGDNTVFNVPTLVGIKKQNIMMDQAANPKVGTSLCRAMQMLRKLLDLV
jgi:hypothetical protein